MWIATKHGFFSIVKKGAPNEWQVRARTRTDIMNLAQALGLEQFVCESLNTDYHYRIIVDDKNLQKLMMFMAASINCDNFKGEISKTANQAHKMHAYHQIWGIMERFQPTPAYSGAPLLSGYDYRGRLSAHKPVQNATEANWPRVKAKKKKPSGAYWRRLRKERQHQRELQEIAESDMF